MGQRLMDFMTSPQLVLMTLAGIVMAVGVPYVAFRTIPGATGLFTPEPEQPADPNPGMDFSELATLPEEMQGSIGLILRSDEPRVPDALVELPEASGFGLVFPVTETVESQQPAFSWTNDAPPPYTVVLRSGTQVIARGDNLLSLNWLAPSPLMRGTAYSWEVTAGNREVETASFIVLDEQSLALWQRIRRDYRESHLVLGLVAEELGLLSTAEREYQALIKQFPQAEAPARLLANVQGLRDDTVLEQPEVF